MKFKGTIIAVIIIILLVIIMRFGFNKSSDVKEVIVEPTERATLEALGGDFSFTLLPTEN